MIVVMKADVLPESPEVAEVVRAAERYPNVHAEVRKIQGATRVLTEVYLLGSTTSVPIEPFDVPMDRVLTERLRGAQYNRALVRHQVVVQEPYTFLYVADALPIVHARFQDIEPAPAGLRYNFIRWWVPKDMQKPGLVP